MKAAVFREPHQPLSIEEVELDEPGPREVLVKTVACGVCHSDLHFIDGFYKWKTPAVLGHEAAGVVEKVGSAVTYLAPGDHVISCLSVFCGECEFCHTGRPFNCMSPDVARGEDETPDDVPTYCRACTDVVVGLPAGTWHHLPKWLRRLLEMMP